MHCVSKIFAAAAVIKLAYDVNIPSVLPAALYRAVCLTPANLADEEEDVATERRGDRTWPFWDAQVVDMDQLTTAQCRAMSEAKSRLDTVAGTLVSEKLTEALNRLVSCKSHDGACMARLRTWLHSHILVAACRVALFKDPLRALYAMKEELSRPNASLQGETCDFCREHLKRAIEEAREYIWTGIPYWFNLRPYPRRRTLLHDLKL